MCNQLIKIQWDPEPYFDQNFGWLILAGRTELEMGYVLRRIKPFALNSLSDFDRALKIQNRLRLHLVEVLPYKVFLGNKTSLSELDKPFVFLSKANLKNWTKFFKNKRFTHETDSIDQARNLGDDLLVVDDFSEATNG